MNAYIAKMGKPALSAEQAASAFVMAAIDEGIAAHDAVKIARAATSNQPKCEACGRFVSDADSFTSFDLLHICRECHDALSAFA